jgi:hypothetical protein
LVVYDGGQATFTEKEWAEHFFHHLSYTGYIYWAKLNAVETSPFDEHPISVETLEEFDHEKTNKNT